MSLSKLEIWKKFLLNFIQNISVVTKADGDKIGKVTESVRKLMCSQHQI